RASPDPRKHGIVERRSGGRASRAELAGGRAGSDGRAAPLGMELLPRPISVLAVVRTHGAGAAIDRPAAARRAARSRGGSAESADHISHVVSRGGTLPEARAPAAYPRADDGVLVPH